MEEVDTRTPEELLDILDQKGKEIQEALSVLRRVSGYDGEITVGRPEMTDVLDSYPYLRCIWPMELISSLDATDHRRNWATPNRPEADQIRNQLEEALEWAFKNNFLSAEAQGRLRGANRAQFHSAKDELLVGKFLTWIGQVHRVPVLNNGKVGDCLIATEPPIYVEVKSIYDIDDEARRTDARLRQVAREIKSGRILEVRVSMPGHLTSSTLFKAHLETNLAGISHDLSDEIELPPYVDPSGMTLSLTCQPFPSDGPTELLIFSGGGGPITSHRDVRRKVQKGAEQLPGPEEVTPSMVVVCRHSDIPTDTDLELIGAMFSLPGLNLGTGAVNVGLTGVSGPDKHTRVSAVARYSERPEHFEVVHNPFAKNPIDPALFAVAGIRQLVLDGPDRMRWTEAY